MYNGHAWDLNKAAVWQRRLIKLRFTLAIDDSNWPLLTGGRCSQVVVKSGLTVLSTINLSHNKSSSGTTIFLRIGIDCQEKIDSHGLWPQNVDICASGVGIGLHRSWQSIMLRPKCLVLLTNLLDLYTNSKLKQWTFHSWLYFSSTRVWLIIEHNNCWT